MNQIQTEFRSEDLTIEQFQVCHQPRQNELPLGTSIGLGEWIYPLLLGLTGGQLYQKKGTIASFSFTRTKPVSDYYSVGLEGSKGYARLGLIDAISPIISPQKPQSIGGNVVDWIALNEVLNGSRPIMNEKLRGLFTDQIVPEVLQRFSDTPNLARLNGCYMPTSQIGKIGLRLSTQNFNGLSCNN